MDLLSAFKTFIGTTAQTLFFEGQQHPSCQRIELIFNAEKSSDHGDVSTTLALQINKSLKQNPRAVAQALQTAFTTAHTDITELNEILATCTIAGPGFLNFTISPAAWAFFARDIITHDADFFKPKNLERLKFLVEFVSANPTGPLHLAHGRNAIIGDVLCSVLSFVGHDVTREFYINDAGNQINKLGLSLRARYLNALGNEEPFPEGGYAGDYLKNVAQEMYAQHQDSYKDETSEFFANYARTAMLTLIRQNLAEYGVSFDHWTSERSIYDSGRVEKTLQDLIAKGVTYEQDGALWLKSTAFGDDKDRVLRKADGDFTYLVPDTAYYQKNLTSGYDSLINILGQDHHGYVTPRNAALQALGLDTNKLTCLIYQLVLMKKNDVYVRMSKRAGTFEQLSDVIKIVGKDVARYFFLNRKADAHLELDLEQALKQNDENPVYYIHYAYVRTESLLTKAADHNQELAAFVEELACSAASCAPNLMQVPETGHTLIKKVLSLRDLLETISINNQTHMLAYYTYDLAAAFHTFYAHTRIIVPENITSTKNNLLMVCLVRSTLRLCLDLLGLSKPKSM